LRQLAIYVMLRGAVRCIRSTALRGHDNGKPTERRGRKTTRLTCANAHQAGRASEWRLPEDHGVNIRAIAVMTALALAPIGCAGTDSRHTATDVTAPTSPGAQPNNTSDSSIASATTPSAPSS